MQYLIGFISQHAVSVVFFNVLLARSGLPLPVVPTLMTAAALARRSPVLVGEIFLAGVAATLLADLTMYSLGRQKNTDCTACCRGWCLPLSIVGYGGPRISLFGPRSVRPVFDNWSRDHAQQVSPVDTAAQFIGYTHVISFLYLVEPKSFDIRLDDQSFEWGWFSCAPHRLKQYPNVMLP